MTETSKALITRITGDADSYVAELVLGTDYEVHWAGPAREPLPIDTTLTCAFDWDLSIRMSGEIAFRSIDREIAGYRLHPHGKTHSGACAGKRETLE